MKEALVALSGGAMWWGGGSVDQHDFYKINGFSLCTIDFGWNIWLRSSMTPMSLVRTFTLTHLKSFLVILHNYFDK